MRLLWWLTKWTLLLSVVVAVGVLRSATRHARPSAREAALWSPRF